MPYQHIDESRRCPRCGQIRDEWYVDPRGKRYFSRCAPCCREAYRLRRAAAKPAKSAKSAKSASAKVVPVTRPYTRSALLDRWHEEGRDADFRAAYLDLETRMKGLAEADGDVFLPGPVPLGPADYVFITMEPSLGRWSSSPDDARAKVETGFRNFTDFTLHFCIRQYLCKPRQRYHLTDLSKGAMLVKRAGDERTERYNRWYPLLLEELDLVAVRGARIFAVGEAVAQHLSRRAFSSPVTTLLHYSDQAAKHRASCVWGHEEAFRQFRDSVSLDDVLATAEDVLQESASPQWVRQFVLDYQRRYGLSESRRQLMFCYRLAFEA